MRIYLVRHGRTALNVQSRAQGHTDEPLDALGLKQADAVARYFADIPLTEIWSSDLIRAFSTAKPTAEEKSIGVEVMYALRERFLGDLEGGPFSELIGAFQKAVAGGENLYKCAPCGCESAVQVYERLSKVAERLSKQAEKADQDPESSVAIFTHDMAKEVLLCNLIQAPVETSRSFRFQNGAITSLRWDQDHWRIETFNETAHLAGLEA